VALGQAAQAPQTTAPPLQTTNPPAPQTTAPQTPQTTNPQTTAPPPQYPAPQTPQTTPAGPQTAAPTVAPTEQEEEAPHPKIKHFSFGLRGRYLPIKSFSVMANNSTQTTTLAPPPAPKDWNFTTATHSPAWGGGVAGEFATGGKWTITAELMYNRLAYSKQTNILWGTVDPTNTTDTRNHEFHTEDTKARLFDLPVMVHYRGLASSGLFSRMYVAAGATARYVTSIKSFLYTIQPDASNSTTSQVVSPSKRLLVGGTIGVGFRVVDDFNIKTTPEIRYTRWGGSTFSQDSTVSPRNQIEVGVAFTF